MNKTKPIKYRHLWAWDKLMGSFPYWVDMNQQRAEEENAPLTAVYKSHDGKWVTYEEIKNPHTKHQIDDILEVY